MLNKFYTPADLETLRVADNKIFGKAGGGTATSTNNLNNQKGSFGEVIIGNILNLIALETPGAYVCHSVGLPEKLQMQGETDHVLIYKNRVILIETKAYSGYDSYSVNREGHLKAGKLGHRKISVDDSHAYSKVGIYQKFFTNRKVQCVLAISRDQIKTYSENGIYKVASLDNIMKLIRDEMEEAESIKEPAWPAVKFFASLCLASAERPKLEIVA